MAATLYNIFVRYTNNGIVISKQTDDDWMSYYEEKEAKEYYTKNRTIYELLVASIHNGSRMFNSFSEDEQNIYNKCNRYLEFLDNIDKNIAHREYIDIKIRDDMYQDPRNYTGPDGPKRKAQELRSWKEANMRQDTEYQKLIADQGRITNPKYNMIFVYDGIGTFAAAASANHQDPYDTDAVIPSVYFDNMKRINHNPWFFYAQYASLKAAMNKAAELVNILGTEGVLIGKCVELDQYIDIV